MLETEMGHMHANKVALSSQMICIRLSKLDFMDLLFPDLPGHQALNPLQPCFDNMTTVWSMSTPTLEVLLVREQGCAYLTELL